MSKKQQRRVALWVPAVAVIVGELVLELLRLLVNRSGVAVVSHVGWRVDPGIFVVLVSGIGRREVPDLAVGNVVDLRNGDARSPDWHRSLPFPGGLNENKC